MTSILMQTASSTGGQAASATLPQPIELFVVDLALAAVGVVILIRAARRYRKAGHGGLLSAAPRRPNTLWPRFIAIPMLIFALLAMSIGSLFAKVSEETFAPELADLLSGSISLLLGGLVCILLAAKTFEQRATGFLFGDRRIADHAMVGVLGLLAGYPLCLAAAEISALLIYLVFPHYDLPQHEVLRLLGQPELPGWVPLVLWLSAVVVAPFAEEVFFRGICQTGLSHLFKRRLIPVVLVGVVFGLAHADQPQVVAPLIVLGLVLGYVYERTGSLVAPITLHALFNLKTMIFFSITYSQT